MSEGATSPPPSGPTRPRPKKSNLFFAAATGALFLVGCLLLTDWLRDREAVQSMPGTSTRGAAGVPPMKTVELKPEHTAWLGGGVAWGPARPDDFGGSRTLFVTGHTKDPPHVVFRRMIGPGPDEATRAEIAAAGPSAQIALRLQATVGRMPQGAFLVRLPADVAAARDGHLRTEPGAVTLAFEGRRGWSYITWIFPEGLDLDRLGAAFRAPPGTLSALPAAHAEHLEPIVAFGGTQGPRTVLCRARGRPVKAVEAVATLLEKQGWERRYVKERTGRSVVRVLAQGDRQVWLSAGESSRGDSDEGGLVSVVLGF